MIRPIENGIYDRICTFLSVIIMNTMKEIFEKVIIAVGNSETYVTNRLHIEKMIL